MRRILLFACALAGCNSSTFVPAGDISHAKDLGSADLAGADLTQVPDLLQAPDLIETPDLLGSTDRIEMPDLPGPSDFGQADGETSDFRSFSDAGVPSDLQGGGGDGGGAFPDAGVPADGGASDIKLTFG
jgi:hypothetical protein